MRGESGVVRGRGMIRGAGVGCPGRRYGRMFIATERRRADRAVFGVRSAGGPVRCGRRYAGGRGMTRGFMRAVGYARRAGTAVRRGSG